MIKVNKFEVADIIQSRIKIYEKEAQTLHDQSSTMDELQARRQSIAIGITNGKIVALMQVKEEILKL